MSEDNNCRDIYKTTNMTPEQKQKIKDYTKHVHAEMEKTPRNTRKEKVNPGRRSEIDPSTSH